MRNRQAVTLVVLLLWAIPGMTKNVFQEVQITDPFIELHTGPGNGYPIFYVEDRGAWIQILKRKTTWFKVKLRNGQIGWVHIDQLEQTVTPSGKPKRFERTDIGDFTDRRWEKGLLGGDFDGAISLTLYGGYVFTPNLIGEISFAQAIGDFSSSFLINANLIGQPFPRWRVSPYFTLGTGGIKTQPRATLVTVEDRTDTLANVGLGIRSYLTRRLIVRFEYKNYIIFSSNDDNEEVNEWKAGLAVFF